MIHMKTNIWCICVYNVYISIQGICSLLVFFFCSGKLQEYQCYFLHAWCWISRPSLRSSRPCCSASASFMLLFRRAKSSEHRLWFLLTLLAVRIDGSLVQLVGTFPMASHRRRFLKCCELEQFQWRPWKTTIAAFCLWHGVILGLHHQFASL